MLLYPVHGINKRRLNKVKKQMKELGSPKIKVLHLDNAFYAIEGTHRLKSAYDMKIPIELIVYGLENAEDIIEDLDLDNDERDWTVEEASEYIFPNYEKPYEIKNENGMWVFE